MEEASYIENVLPVQVGQLADIFIPPALVMFPRDQTKKHGMCSCFDQLMEEEHLASQLPMSMQSGCKDGSMDLNMGAAPP